jgi:uncharacterized protein YndB with AHSA1/START domain
MNDSAGLTGTGSVKLREIVGGTEKMPDILHRVGIRSSSEKVFEALSQEKGLAGWWTKDVKASPTVDAVNQFRFGRKGFNEMKVLELSHGKRVKWLCVDGAKEWIGTEFTFDLRETDGVTVLLFAQRGWREQVEFMHCCSTKWEPIFWV